jgi:hypothetical protein
MHQLNSTSNAIHLPGAVVEFYTTFVLGVFSFRYPIDIHQGHDIHMMAIMLIRLMTIFCWESIFLEFITDVIVVLLGVVVVCLVGVHAIPHHCNSALL